MYDLILLASTLFYGAVVLAYLRHPAASLFHPAGIYLLFHGLVFTVRPIIARIYDFDLIYRVYDFHPSLSDKITAILAADLGLLVFVTAALWIANARPAIIARTDWERVRHIMRGPIFTAALLLTPLAVAAALGNWQLRAEGFASMTMDAGTGFKVNTTGNGWFTTSSLMLGSLAIMVLWAGRFRWWTWLYFALLLVLQGGSGGRGPIVFAVIGVGVLVLLENRRRWFDWRGVALVLLGIAVFNSLVVDRGAGIRQLVDGSRHGTEVQYRDYDDQTAPLEHMDFANLEYLEFLVYAVPQRTGTYDYFLSYLQLFTEPIPRKLWPGKPVGAPIQRFQLFDYGRPVGMTMSVPGVGWIELGYVGVVIQSLIFALLYGGIYRLLLMRRPDGNRAIAYALLMGSSLVIYRDGTILTFARTLPFYLGPFLLAVLLARINGLGRAYALRADEPTPPESFLAQDPAERRRLLARQAEERAQ